MRIHLVRKATFGLVCAVSLLGCGGSGTTGTPTQPVVKYPIEVVADRIDVSRLPLIITFRKAGNAIVVLSEAPAPTGTIALQGAATGNKFLADFPALQTEATTNLMLFGTQAEVFEISDLGVLKFRITTVRAAPSVASALGIYVTKKANNEPEAQARTRWESFVRDSLPSVKFLVQER